MSSRCLEFWPLGYRGRHSSWFPVLGPVVMGLSVLEEGLRTRGLEDLKMGVGVVGLWFIRWLSSPRRDEGKSEDEGFVVIAYLSFLIYDLDIEIVEFGLGFWR